MVNVSEKFGKVNACRTILVVAIAKCVCREVVLGFQCV